MGQLPGWTENNAHFSDEKHRVWLRRNLVGANGPAVFCLHNPSTAGHLEDDQTSRRGAGFANAMGANCLIFVNAVTACATKADDLDGVEDIIGPMATEALEAAAQFCLENNGVLIAAWGAPKGTKRVRRIMERRFSELRRMDLPWHFMRLTKTGFPEHLLYLPAILRPQPWIRT